MFSTELRRAKLVVLSGRASGVWGGVLPAVGGFGASARGAGVGGCTKGTVVGRGAREAGTGENQSRGTFGSDGVSDVEDWSETIDAIGAENVVITDGARAVNVFADGRQWKVATVMVKPVNPIGSGDATLAGIACGLWGGRSLVESVRLGVACGAANALTETSGVVRRAGRGEVFYRLYTRQMIERSLGSAVERFYMTTNTNEQPKTATLGDNDVAAIDRLRKFYAELRAELGKVIISRTR